MTLSISNELQALRQQYARRTARDLPAGKPAWILALANSAETYVEHCKRWDIRSPAL